MNFDRTHRPRRAVAVDALTNRNMVNEKISFKQLLRKHKHKKVEFINEWPQLRSFPFPLSLKPVELWESLLCKPHPGFHS